MSECGQCRGSGKMWMWQVAPMGSDPDEPCQMCEGGRLVDHNKFVELYRRKNTLEAELRAVTKEVAAMSDEILDQLDEMGLQNIKTKGGATIYARQSRIPTAVDGNHERAYDALVAAGLPHLAKKNFHWKSVLSAILEMESRGEPLPEAFDGAIEIYEKFTAVVLAAGKDGD